MDYCASFPDSTVFCMAGRDSVVGVATCHGLDGPGIESRQGEIFCYRPDRSWALPSLLYTGYPVSSPGAKQHLWRYHPSASSAKVKGRLVIPLLLMWAFIVCSRVNFTILYIIFSMFHS